MSIIGPGVTENGTQILSQNSTGTQIISAGQLPPEAYHDAQPSYVSSQDEPSYVPPTPRERLASAFEWLRQMQLENKTVFHVSGTIDPDTFRNDKITRIGSDTLTLSNGRIVTFTTNSHLTAHLDNMTFGGLTLSARSAFEYHDVV